MSWCGGSRFVLRLRRSVAAVVAAPMLVGGSWLITGGLGGLGLRASVLLGGNAARVVLTSRSGRAAGDEQKVTTRASSANVKLAACDVCRWAAGAAAPLDRAAARSAARGRRRETTASSRRSRRGGCG